jgi:hypothetical protein
MASEDFRDTGGTPFRQLELLEKFSNAPVAVAPGYCPARTKLREAHGPVWTWVAEHNQLFRADAHLDRLAVLITAVIQRVDDAFLTSVTTASHRARTTRGSTL